MAPEKPRHPLYGDLPMGFGMALMKNQAAMNRFASLSEEEQREIVEGVHGISSRAEMRDYVERTLVNQADDGRTEGYAELYKNSTR